MNFLVNRIMSDMNKQVKSIKSTSEYFHLIFEFYNEKKREEFNNIIFHSSIGNVQRELRDQIIQFDNWIIFHIEIRNPTVINLQLPFESTRFKSEFQKILKSVKIEEHTDSDLSEKKLNWKTIKRFYKEPKNKINFNELLSVVEIFTKSLDSISLEAQIMNIILFYHDSVEREKYIDSLNLEKPYNLLKDLFGTSTFLSHKQIRRILNFIDTDDFIIKKAVFTYFHEKDRSMEPKKHFEIYRNLKGIKPFTERELLDINNSLTKRDVFFELFFKQYYHSKIKEQMEGITNLERIVKIEIPINPKAYELKIYNEETKKFIMRFFSENLRLLLRSCKRAIYHETKRVLNKRVENLIVCFDISTSEEYLEELRVKGVYYDDSFNLIQSKSDFCHDLLKNGDKDKTPEFWFYCIFEGNYTELKGDEYSREQQFGIKDINEKTLICKIKQFKPYFNQFDLNLEAPIIVQSFFHLKYRIRFKKWEIIPEESYLDIIDLKILRDFKPISITVAKNKFGVIKLENTPKGLRKYRYYSKGEPSYDIILHKPINLLAYYKGENDLFFEILIGKEKVCKTKLDLYNWIENETNFAATSGKELRDAINNVLFKYIEDKNLTPLPMFHTAGVFLKDDDFIVVHPFKEGLKVIGENDIQYDVIEAIREKRIDFEGELTKAYYKILQIDGMREDIRAGIYGFASIQPFFFALSKVLDIFPNLFLIGLHGSGKTTLTELLFNILYGTKMKSPDSIDSTARLTKYSTETTFSLNVDDIDILGPKKMNYIKTNSTRKGTRNRLTLVNKLISEQTYTSYTGTANNRNFLTGNENDAFRKRCFIFETMEGIDFKKDTTNFESIRMDIIEGKIFGFYLLEQAIEFFNILSDKEITSYFKLTSHINQIKRKIKEQIIQRTISLSDGRRLTIYTLIYIGWEIWDYIFKKAGLEDHILSKYLNMDQPYLWDFIRDLEETEKDITITTFDSILEFYEQNRDKFIFRKTPKGKIVLLMDFIEKYDKFARLRGYETLKNLKELAHLQSQILGVEINTATIYFRNSIDDSTDRKHGVIFYYEEICKERHKKIEDSLSGDKKKQIPNIIQKVKEIFQDIQLNPLDIDELHEILEIYFNDKEFVENAMDYLFENDYLRLDEIDDSKCVFHDPERFEIITLE
ncbi:hypothetical protein LCGC14_0506370 [marine sediment metagenome]|uniref:Uncharacterized protein n=1 Tax=marine sediment metagenome TaxID=412755 RepID=A0A0F9SKX8_9ZZZZ